MSKSNVSTTDLQKDNQANYNKNGPENIHTIEPQEVLVINTEYDVETNGQSHNNNIKISDDVTSSRMVSRETVLDLQIMKPNAIPNNVLFYSKNFLKKKIMQNPYRKHQQSPFQGYPPNYPPPPSGYPPSYPAQGYPPGNPPQGYSYPGNPPQGYPPQGYPQQGLSSFCPPGNDDDQNYQPIPYDPETRNQFIRKVMTIVLMMLIITALFVALVIFEPTLRKTFRKFSLVILLPASLTLLMTNYAFMCSPCTKTAPWNCIALTITALSMSLIAAVISTRYRTEIIMFAVIATAGVVLACIGLACTSFDFTKWILFFIVISIGVSLVGGMLMIYMVAAKHYMKTEHVVILIISVIVLSIGLVIELQMIIGGKTVQLDEDEYSLAAFMLYTSIVHIFIHMVQIIGILNN